MRRPTRSTGNPITACGWDVVEVDAKARVRDPVDDLAEVLEDPVVAHSLEVERRQHHDAAAAGLDRVAAELHRVRNGAEPRPRHEKGRVDARFEQRIEEPAPLRETEGERLSGRPEGGEPGAPVLEQPGRVVREPDRIRFEVRVVGGEHRRDHAVEEAVVTHRGHSPCAPGISASGDYSAWVAGHSSARSRLRRDRPAPPRASRSGPPFGPRTARIECAGPLSAGPPPRTAPRRRKPLHRTREPR